MRLAPHASERRRWSRSQTSVLNAFEILLQLSDIDCAYQSECGDQRAHERHWVSVHWWRHAEHTRYADCFAGASAINATPTIMSAGMSPSRCPRSPAFWNACTAMITA